MPITTPTLPYRILFKMKSSCFRSVWVGYFLKAACILKPDQLWLVCDARCYAHGDIIYWGTQIHDCTGLALCSSA